MTRIWLVLLAALLVAGCAPTKYKPVQLDAADFFKDRQKVIGVTSNKVPAATAHMMGPQGLLDIAINKGNAKAMTAKLEAMDLARVAAVPGNMADAMTRRGLQVRKLDEVEFAKLPSFKAAATPELYAPRDFREFKAKGLDRVLYVNFVRIGTLRTYQGFIPGGPPRAVFTATGMLVDTSDNKLLWYGPYDQTAAIPAPWDQEPDFPNVLSAVSSAIQNGALQLERSLFATGN